MSQNVNIFSKRMYQNLLQELLLCEISKSFRMFIIKTLALWQERKHDVHFLQKKIP